MCSTTNVMSCLCLLGSCTVTVGGLFVSLADVSLLSVWEGRLVDMLLFLMLEEICCVSVSVDTGHLRILLQISLCCLSSFRSLSHFQITDVAWPLFATVLSSCVAIWLCSQTFIFMFPTMCVCFSLFWLYTSAMWIYCRGQIVWLFTASTQMQNRYIYYNLSLLLWKCFF